MSDDSNTIWETYVASWKAPTLTEKRALFETCLEPNCVYTDPLVEARSWEELAKSMLDFHQQFPGAHFVTTRFMAHHDKSVAQWQMCNADGVVIGDGISYAEYSQRGKLSSMTAFFVV